jgi:hypothetical protein
MLTVLAGIQDSLEFEKANNNLKKENQHLGSYLFFGWGRFAFLYGIIEYCVLEHLSFHCSAIL